MSDLRLLAQWSDQLDPDRRLDVASSSEARRWYVDLDAWKGTDGEEHALRGPSAARSIVRGVELASVRSEHASTHLFAGFRGTGKTTELGRIARALGQTKETGFSVLRVNARRYHRLSRALSIEELTVLLVAGIGEAAFEVLGEKALPKLAKSGVWERIRGWFEKVVESGGVTLKLGVVDIKSALLEGSSLTDQLRKALGDQSSTMLKEFLHGFVLEIAMAIRPRQLVVLVDDLDKFTSPAIRVANVYQAMADLFFDHFDLLKLPSCHTIYTVPPYLAFLNQNVASNYKRKVHILPSVRVRGRPPIRASFPQGVAALEQTMARRVDLDRLFGDARSACMERLVLASGGNLRDLGELMLGVMELAVERSLPVGMPEVEATINQYGAPRTLLKNDIELLLDVSAGGDLKEIEPERLGKFASAMDQHLMLCYWNGEFWYDAHPIIAPKIARVREQASSSERA